ncbi:endonuclease [Altererythrobacter sediminis]|uniref:Endonuclease n=2 Tax=Allopontixanthobacter sediminis TaxID=1689985 RepID=A0A845B5B2_9SPHN|nr:endonuclease/exonuclease/phosphatase family protein [Allopontixanthobacter sediminis]MXP44712.1 endonuclease [Allopontixanthobacter sediminis]
MQLTFASYNIHKAVGTDGRRDPERIIAVLREMNADIVALQEVDLRFGDRATVISRAALDDTKWRAIDVAKRPRSLGWHGNALLVRRDLEILGATPIDLPTLEPRGAISADIEADGQRFRVVGTHLDLSGLRRHDQVRAILKHCGSQDVACPTVVMGDFNQWGHRGGIMRAFVPPWQVLSPGRSFPSRRPLAPLDRIILSREWTGMQMGVHHSRSSAEASDHLPVWTSARLPRK